MEENSNFNQTEETVENSEIEQIQSKPVEPKIEKPIDESPKLHFKPGMQVFSRTLSVRRLLFCNNRLWVPLKPGIPGHARVDMYIIVGFRSNVTSNLTIQF